LDKKVAALLRDVDDLLEGDKERKLNEAEKKLKKLDNDIEDLNLKRVDAAKHQREYQDLIDDAKEEPGDSDPNLMNKLKKLDGDAK
jgi:peptidoglycan hydrolase CwlO-like protein